MAAFRKYLRWQALALMALGAAAGYLYYRTVGCTTGSCPITGNPFVASIYGAALGFVLSIKSPPKTDK